MRLIFSKRAWEDYQYWIRTDKQTLKRINLLIEDTTRNPFEGLGKPEPLRYQLAGFWSRRITAEHRFVYAVEDGDLLIAQLRYHYES
ncbi:Txe/YoeB family addiction module toxin [Luteolibacter flavescens]|uniref:Putative mRNA interferase YoeB n=1 Tax=Luteolibacter flavescens TaxID=1859460 RepID=A0ABT3FUG5_9BACT|nr:Txe/YoeB family addiction module toxin [Luteolibacter flavescens]MCW1886630.1 Txe/YoeB family addiction module toxin [Luteolibacter flavescens]